MIHFNEKNNESWAEYMLLEYRKSEQKEDGLRGAKDLKIIWFTVNHTHFNQDPFPANTMVKMKEQNHEYTSKYQTQQSSHH